jgi:hypothetical protein
MNNVTITNNDIEGRADLAAIRIRVIDLNKLNGTKTPTSTFVDVPVGGEERINFDARSSCLEVREAPLGEESDAVEHDAGATKAAFDKLRSLITSIPAIRADLTLSETDRDQKAATAWGEALRLASQ